jgi:hypothetical protein
VAASGCAWALSVFFDFEAFFIALSMAATVMTAGCSALAAGVFVVAWACSALICSSSQATRFSALG